MKRQTAKWVQKAEKDLIIVRAVEHHNPPVYDGICYHCQQSAEKYLKALLQEWGVLPPRTHNLTVLLNLLQPHDPALGTLKRELKSLARYAVDVRYPNGSTRKRQAQAAIRHAAKVRQEILARLGLTP
jgi:HEPN domain-containing protein